MPRPSAKKAAENKVPPPVAAAPQMQHQPMMPMAPQAMGIPQHQQMHIPQQQQHFMPQVQMQQQQVPVGIPQLQSQQPGRPPVDGEKLLALRDGVVGRLNSLSEIVRTLTNDYIRQCNVLLGEPVPDGNPVDFFGNFDAATAQLFGALPDSGAGDEKKERKKRTHDPDAPKRPLTPYFLYMQSARSIIANDLGAEAPKGAVQEEGQRRWATMDAADKNAWNRAYQYNLHLYNARVHSYKAGNLDAKNMSDEEAQRYIDAHDIPPPDLKKQNENSANDQDAIAQQLQQVPTTQVETPNISSPDKKRRRASGKPAAEAEEPKKSGRKKAKN